MSRNVFAEYHITLRDVPEIIKFGHRRKRAVMLLGGAGLGKSQIVKQVANALFGKSKTNMVDLRLSDKEPTDVSGVQIPYTDEHGVTRTVYATPRFWPTDPKWQGVIFLDELLHAEPHLQHVAYQIMLDRRIGEYEFPAGSVMVGAGNRPGDGAILSMLEGPLANRMIIVEVTYSTEVFLEDFAYHHNVHTSVVGHLKQSPSSIENFEAMQDAGCPSFATPRSWVTASDALYDFDDGLLSDRHTKAILQGCIGTLEAKALWLYHTKKRDVPAIADILSGTVKTHTGPRTSDIQWILGHEGATHLRRMTETSETDDDIVAAAANFLEYMDDNFGEENKDFVVSIFMSFVQKNAYGNAILKNNGRDRLIAKLLAKYPRLMKIVHDFAERFADTLKELDK